MDTLAPGQLRFAIHGPNVDTDDVAGSVFARKLLDLIQALRAADRAANSGKLKHEYFIKKLATSTPTVVLSERPLVETQGSMLPMVSAIAAFGECARAIQDGDRETALFYSACTNKIVKLASDKKDQYKYAEVWTQEKTVIRVDGFLSQKAERISVPESEYPSAMQRQEVWFEGVSNSSFDGVIKAVDLRGSLPELKLILSAGGRQIDCVGRRSQVEEIKNSLDLRCRVSGLCFYEPDDGLPKRMEITSIEVVGSPDDFSVWADSFDPFEPAPWEDDET